MPLHRFRRQYEQLSQFERGRIIGMMEAGWTARRIVRHSDCVVVFSNESRFIFSSDDNRARVWRPRGKRLNPVFALQRHIALTAVVMVWGTIAYNTRSPLVLICDTTRQPSGMSMTFCNHMCCYLCNGSQEPFFNKTMLGLTRKGCYKIVSALLLPFVGLLAPQICPQSRISGIIWGGELGIPRV
ncbi:uncharacterized protein TNCV_4081441 [Trichonephila clavipes]|nr:uncharacterized protein TNCV_4081441 [Trichonephila clavipes]